MRLNVFIAKATKLSRRKADIAISDGRIAVDGKREDYPGRNISDANVVTFDGKVILAKSRSTWILMNKPAGYITTKRDESGRKTVMNLLPEKFARLFPVGRLDTGTTGVLLFTDEGEVAQIMLHPRFEVPRKYRATISGRLSDGEKAVAKKGVILDGKRISIHELKFFGNRGGNDVYEIELHEGRYHEVKRFFKALGHGVISLERISYAGITAEKLAPGRWRILSREEVAEMKARLENYAAGYRSRKSK